MADELHFVGTPAQTGLTVVARIYDNLGAQVGGDVACAENATNAIYVGDMPATGAGVYIVRFIDSSGNFLAAGSIDWNGTEEVFNSGIEADIAALNDFDPAADTVARVTLVDTTTVNTDMRGTDGANTTAPDNASITAILADTNELQTNQGDWATATGFAVAGDVTGAQAAIIAEVQQSEADVIAALPAAGPTAAQIYGEFTASTNADAFKADTAALATQADIAALNNLSTADVTAAVPTAAQIATATEQAILNEGDGDQVLNAIVGAIGNTNVDEIALVAAIRTDLERVGGAIDNLPTLTEMEASAPLTDTADTSLLATSAQVAALNDLSTADVAAELATYDAPTKAELDAAETALLAAIGSSGGLTAAQTTQLNELWQIRGLDASNPVTITTGDETSGTIDIAVTGDGKTTSTLTRQ